MSSHTHAPSHVVAVVDDVRSKEFKVSRFVLLMLILSMILCLPLRLLTIESIRIVIRGVSAPRLIGYLPSATASGWRHSGERQSESGRC